MRSHYHNRILVHFSAASRLYHSKIIRLISNMPLASFLLRMWNGTRGGADVEFFGDYIDRIGFIKRYLLIFNKNFSLIFFNCFFLNIILYSFDYWLKKD